LLEEAAGHPLALTELPGAAQALAGADALRPAPLPLTARLEQAFTARVSELPAATRTVLLVAALNDSTSVAEALEAGALVVGAKVDVTVLVPAVEARLVDLGTGTVSFRHPPHALGDPADGGPGRTSGGPRRVGGGDARAA
jgi:hypothetical protein